MSLVIEDGSGGNSAAVSYLDVARFRQFFTDRGESFDESDEEISGFIMLAMDVIEGFTYFGERVNLDQPLSFPRSGVVMSDGRYLSIDSVPKELKAALAYMARYFQQGEDPNEVRTAGVIMEKVSSLQIQYDSKNAQDRVEVTDLFAVANQLRYLAVEFSSSVSGGVVAPLMRA